MIAHSRPALDNSDAEAVARVIKSGQIAQGALVEKFEKKLADYIGVKGGVAASSGTAALHLALLSLGIKEGDEVILPSFVCAALLNSVLCVGAKPVFADIGLEDYNISIRDVKRRLTKKTKAIIVVHIFGQPADIADFKRLGIPVVEDIAHSIGAEYKDKRVGSFGVASVASFYATKVITTGEGGMVLSSDKRLLENMRDLREYDNKKSFRLRFNYKMTDIQAVLGLSQLKKLGRLIQRRRRIARIYDGALMQTRISRLPDPLKGKEGIYYRYIIRANEKASSIIEIMRKKGITCAKPVFMPLHRYMGNKGRPRTTYVVRGHPNTELAWQNAVSVPLYPSLTDIEINQIKHALSDLARRYG